MANQFPDATVEESVFRDRHGPLRSLRKLSHDLLLPNTVRTISFPTDIAFFSYYLAIQIKLLYTVKTASYRVILRSNSTLYDGACILNRPPTRQFHLRIQSNTAYIMGSPVEFRLHTRSLTHVQCVIKTHGALRVLGQSLVL